MKRLLFLGLLCAASVGAAQAQPRSDVRVSFEFFYSSLAPYGEWIEFNPGFYVWRPVHIRQGWRPYMHGRWVWTDYGWYWASYEPFGWAVFHYGRWYYDDFYGWIWVPDYVWGPAWVEWRYNDDYIGWAPLPPYATFRISVGIHFTRAWVSPVHYWTFVPCRYFTSSRVVRYVVPPERTQRFFGRTRSVTRYDSESERIINRGIDVGFVERQGRTRVEHVSIVETRERGAERISRQGGRERLEVYRPDRLEVEQTVPQRIDARRAERRSSLEIDKIERSLRRGPDATRVPERRETPTEQMKREDRREVGRQRSEPSRPEVRPEPREPREEGGEVRQRRQRREEYRRSDERRSSPQNNPAVGGAIRERTSRGEKSDRQAERATERSRDRSR